MSENNTTTPIKIEIPASADNAIKNLTDKPTQRIGATMADIWDIIFNRVSLCAEKIKIKNSILLEQYRQEIESSISKIPSEKLIDPSLHITVQALDNSKYCIEEKELREMFASLISNSMNSDYSTQIHPSFAEIIKQMSVLDAQIIRLFKADHKPVIGLPVCQFQIAISNPGNVSLGSIPDHIFLELPDVDFQLCSQSLSSLSRLGIISISYTKKISSPGAYDKFLHHPLYEHLKEMDMPFSIELAKGVTELTPLGRSFVTVCIPD